MDHAAPNGDRIADPTRGALAQRYAEGILRFFRARLALAQSRNDDACALAWSYLQAVDPEQVPPDARPAFCDLTRLMYWQTIADSFDCAEFREQMAAIASRIDRFLDSLDAEAARGRGTRC